MIVLYILLGLFSLLFALTLLPLTVQASYREDKLELELWVGGVKIPLPQKEKTEKEQPQATASAPKTSRKEKKKARRFSKWNEMVPLLQKALSGGVKALGILFAHLSIPSLTLSITVGGSGRRIPRCCTESFTLGRAPCLAFCFGFAVWKSFWCPLPRILTGNRPVTRGRSFFVSSFCSCFGPLLRRPERC